MLTKSKLAGADHKCHTMIQGRLVCCYRAGTLSCVHVQTGSIIFVKKFNFEITQISLDQSNNFLYLLESSKPASRCIYQNGERRVLNFSKHSYLKSIDLSVLNGQVKKVNDKAINTRCNSDCMLKKLLSKKDEMVCDQSKSDGSHFEHGNSVVEKLIYGMMKKKNTLKKLKIDDKESISKSNSSDSSNINFDFFFSFMYKSVKNFIFCRMLKYSINSFLKIGFNRIKNVQK